MSEQHRRKVTSLAPEIQKLYDALEVGKMDINGFRKSLATFGVRETPAFMSLLRSSFSFSELIHALCRDDRDMSAFAAGEVSRTADTLGIFESSPHEHLRRHGHRPVSHDVIAWSDAGESSPATGRASSPLGKKGIGGEDHAAIILRGASFNADGASAGTAQKDMQTRLGHTAGFSRGNECDRLREDLYMSIRLLDAGRITTSDFERRLLRNGTCPSKAITSNRCCALKSAQSSLSQVLRFLRKSLDY